MRKAVLAVLLVGLVAGCGGGKKTSTVSSKDYAAALSKLCRSANQQVAGLQLTTSIKTWKKNGEQAATIADHTVKGFEALTPPASLQAAAKAYTSASEDIDSAVKDAADAARDGNTKKFEQALGRQQNATSKAYLAAGRIGATGCTGG